MPRKKSGRGRSEPIRHKALDTTVLGSRFKKIREWENLDPGEAQNRKIRWLEKNPYLLGDYQRLLIEREIDRQKALARASGDLRRLRILENGFDTYSLTQVLLKYGKDCHICKTPIDLKASRRVGVGNWLLGLHIDHLVAIAKGGPDTLANVRPSHAICNLKKGTS